ncbi:MAG: glutamate synthase (NADPH), homotetrameric [Candidatus Melainabacteria bacterium RIFOXYA2_FULL_32_9]|nr:MAG: glutamate synthase (NADPH), homotetrameric [Candidatus Melainabacteria bacterium RIFOXYA2_FULL_32_9]
MAKEKIERQIPITLDPEYRSANFEEVEKNFTDEQALNEAKRCINCKNPKCVAGCPVNINIPGFIQEIAKENLDAAGKLVRETNLLPSVCGRVCPQERQCEGSCVLGIKDKPVAIGALERYVGDKTDSSSLQITSNGQKVAIIGSGCAGISAAADLAKSGYQVTVFEALHALGGVLRYGIPEFRLPRTALDREINSLKQIGVEFKTNVIIGKSLTIQDLFSDGFEAIFVCSGAGLPKMLNISGENLNGVYSANEFLTRVNLMRANRSEYPTPIRGGRKVAVVGGGNTAMDAARTAKRIGFDEVTIVYRRSEAELPARKAEIEHAKEEGVNFLLLHSPVEITGYEGYVLGMQLQVMELGEPDASGRRKPIPTDKTVNIEVDTVIVALGTNPNPIIQKSALEEGLNLDVNAKGYIIIDPETGLTSIPGVFAGGDVAPVGESNAINAMGAGKKAAKAINEYLEKQKTLSHINN